VWFGIQIKKIKIATTLLFLFLILGSFYYGQNSSQNTNGVDKNGQNTEITATGESKPQDGGSGGVKFSGLNIDFVVPENPAGGYDPETGQVVIYTTDGQEAGRFDVPKNENGETVFPVTVRDKDGKVYEVKESSNLPTTISITNVTSMPVLCRGGRA